MADQDSPPYLDPIPPGKDSSDMVPGFVPVGDQKESVAKKDAASDDANSVAHTKHDPEALKQAAEAKKDLKADATAKAKAQE